MRSLFTASRASDSTRATSCAANDAESLSSLKTCHSNRPAQRLAHTSQIVCTTSAEVGVDPISLTSFGILAALR